MWLSQNPKMAICYDVTFNDVLLTYTNVITSGKIALWRSFTLGTRDEISYTSKHGKRSVKSVTHQDFTRNI